MKTKATHTPGPWSFFKRKREHLGKRPEMEFHIGNNEIEHSIGEVEEEANAKFIVTACNSHADLLEALELAIKVMSYVQDKAPSYDWNADPLYLTLKTGGVFEKAFKAIEKARAEGAP